MDNVLLASSLAAPGHRGRSIGAVIAGFAVILITHTGADAILHATGVFPPAGQTMGHALFALATLYRTAFSVLGAYVTAKVAPARPMKHALVLGSIGVVLSLVGMLATFGRGPEFGPLWYPLLLVLVSLPCCWVGAKIALREH